MPNYIQVRVDVTPCTTTATDLLAAFLADAEFESFVPDEKGLTAFVESSRYNNDEVERILAGFPMDVKFTTTVEEIESRDWNEEWEKNYFKPIVIEDRCVIHSTFHNDVPSAEYDIVIDPKMAFGTGHHFTTALMIRYLLELDLEGKQLVDVGTGTGILAILAAMRGAGHVMAIEIDADACANALENIAINGVDIELYCGDASLLNEAVGADLLLANINRNIILNDIESYASALKTGGMMLLSGFYEKDIPMIAEAASEYGLVQADYKVDNDWVSVRFVKH